MSAARVGEPAPALDLPDPGRSRVRLEDLRGRLLGGARPQRPGSDTLPLGGDFVVAPDGILIYARPQQRGDRPPVAHLLRALERAAGGAG